MDWLQPVRKIKTAWPLRRLICWKSLWNMPTVTTNTISGLPSTVQLVKRSQDQVVDMILGARLFQDMNQDDVTILARFLTLHNVEQGAVVFHEGDTGDFLGLIVEGAVELFKDGPNDAKAKVASEGAGKLLGEMALVDGEPRSATARFLQPGHGLILTKDNFQRLLHEHPRAAANFLFRLSRLLSQRLRRTTGMLVSCLKAG